MSAMQLMGVRARAAMAALISAVIVAAGLGFHAAAPAQAATTVVAGIVQAGGSPVADGYQVYAVALNGEGFQGSWIDSTSTDASGAFSLNVDFATTPNVRLLIQPKTDDAYGLTGYDLVAADAGFYSSPESTWELRPANVFGKVTDSDGTTALVNANVTFMTSGGQTDRGVLALQSGSGGLFKAYVPNVDSGVTARVEPPFGTTTTGAALSIAISGAVGSAVSPYVFALAEDNVSGTLVGSAGGAGLPGKSVCLVEVLAGGGTRNLQCDTTDENGVFGLYGPFGANDPSLQLRAQSSDPAQGATTTWELAKATGSGGGYKNKTWTLDGVSLFGVVQDATGALLPGASVQITKVNESGEQVSFVTSVPAAEVTATVAISAKVLDFSTLAAGEVFEVAVGPPYSGTANGAPIKRTYTSAPGSSQTWRLDTPNVTATVYDASATPGQQGALLPRAAIQVTRVDANGNQLAYLGYQQADSTGKVQLKIDFTQNSRVKVQVAGPYQQQTVGAANSYILTAASPDASATSYLNQTWSLVGANVVGVVRDVDGKTLANASVSIQGLDASGYLTQSLGWTQTDADGAFKANVPDNLLAKGANGVAIMVQPPWGYTGLGVNVTKKYIPTDADIPFINETIDLLPANAAVVVTDNAGSPLNNAWVNVNHFSEPMGVSGSTRSNGVALVRLSVASQQELLDNGYTFNIQAPYNQRNDYASVMENGSFTLTDAVLDLPTYRVKLPSPNLRLLVTETGTNAAATLPYAGIEVSKANDPYSFSWSNSDALGKANLNLADGAWQFTVRPPSFLDSPTLVAPRTYSVTITDGLVSSIKDSNNQDVPVVGGRYHVGGATPTMSLIVKAGDPLAPVGGGWVEVVEIDAQGQPTKWLNGAQVRSDGKVGLTLAKGDYRVTARAPWATTTYSSAAPCVVSVAANGSLTTPDGDTGCGAPSSGFYTRTLRTPNVVATIKAPGGASAVGYSNLCIVSENQWNCASGDASGKVSLFVESATDVEYEANPPWNSSTYSIKRGTIPAGELTDGTWASGKNKVIELTSPNVRVEVSAGGRPVTNGWVTVGREVDGRWQYISGGSTGSTGTASLSIPDFSTSGSYCLDVWPGPVLAATYSQVHQCGTPFAGAVGASPAVLGVTLNPANAVTYVTTADGVPNRWGSVLVLNAAGSVLGIVFLQFDGKMATYLADGTYELVFFPASGATGATVSRTVTVSGGVADLPSGISLGRGNLRGTVYLQNTTTPVAGFVRAVNGPDVQVTTINNAGEFMMELTPGTWEVSVISVSGSASTNVTIVEGSSPVTVSLEVAQP